jgi:tetratricopeptide (TPR) repeat protein
LAPQGISVRRLDWPGLVSGAILAAGALAIYSRTFSVPLLYDDDRSIAENLTIRHLWPIWQALSPPNDVGVGGRPLLNLSYALNYAVGGTAVSGYHLVNLLIHLLAAWTLFALVRRTLLHPVLANRFGSAATGLALAVSAIWAWHPLQTESMTYLSQRAESLMGLLYLLTLYFFVRGAEANDEGDSRIWFPLSVLACLAGVATKEIIATAPVLVFLYDRTFISGSFSGAWRRHWPVYAALAATWVPLGWLMIGMQDRGVGFGHAGIAWWAYGLAECRVVIKYLLLAFWPHPLAFDYGRIATVQMAEVWPYALVLALLLIFTVTALLRPPNRPESFGIQAIGFAGAWFFLILAPTSSIIPLAGAPMAESRMYLPLAGVVALAVLGAFALAGRRILPLFAVVAAALSVASFQRNQDYSSALALWTDTVAKIPANVRAHNDLGVVLAHLPCRLPDAVAQYEQALRLNPDFAEAHYNLAIALAQIPGRMPEAITHYEQTLRLKPDSAEAHNNLAAALAQIPGRMPEAIAHYEKALRLKPGDAEAHYNLAIALAQTPGRMPEAVAQFEQALRLKPDFVDAHYNLAIALAQTPGRMPEAVAQFEQTLRLKPDFAEAHNNLAVAYANTGNLSEAIRHLEIALRLNPDYSDARRNLEKLKASAGVISDGQSR